MAKIFDDMDRIIEDAIDEDRRNDDKGFNSNLYAKLVFSNDLLDEEPKERKLDEIEDLIGTYIGKKLDRAGFNNALSISKVKESVKKASSSGTINVLEEFNIDEKKLLEESVMPGYDAALQKTADKYIESRDAEKIILVYNIIKKIPEDLKKENINYELEIDLKDIRKKIADKFYGDYKQITDMDFKTMAEQRISVPRYEKTKEIFSDIIKNSGRENDFKDIDKKMYDYEGFHKKEYYTLKNNMAEKIHDYARKTSYAKVISGNEDAVMKKLQPGLDNAVNDYLSYCKNYSRLLFVNPIKVGEMQETLIGEMDELKIKYTKELKIKKTT